MAERAPESVRMSLAEYLAFENASDTRHEYAHGRVYAMSGAHSQHNRIAGNIHSHLWAAARGGPCRTYMSDMKLRTPRRRIYYPDVMAVCTPRRHDGLIVKDQCIVVEVISKSTRRTDWSEKRPAYLRIPSLRTHLIVEQLSRQVDCWLRDDAGEWRHETLLESGAIAVPCPELSLELDDIYEGIDFEPSHVRRVREADAKYQPG